MFVLRTIMPDGVEHNTLLGDKFSITDKERSPDSFKELLKSSEVVEANRPKVYTFVGNEHGNRHIPLFYEHEHYIMNDNGKTFARLSGK